MNTVNYDSEYKDKVSIITPAHNSTKYIEATINCVLNQTYQNWEMIIADDCSTDNTCEIVRKYQEKDSRIKLIELKENIGAPRTRNKALELCGGRYVAYLDSDDIWMPDKLEKQVNFMRNNNYAFSCVSYEIIDGDGKSLNKYIHMLPDVDYRGFLTHNLLQTVGIMADISVVDRKNLIMPDIIRPEDAATWLQVLKSGHKCYGLDEILAQYRRVENSLSGNKIQGAKGMWKLYRDIEHLSLPFSCYCFVRYAFLAVWKRFYNKK